MSGPYTASAYITINASYGSVSDRVRRNTVSPLTQSFNYGDVLDFECVFPYAHGCHMFFNYSLKGWHAYDATVEYPLRKFPIPMYFTQGSETTAKISLTMLYTGSVAITAEVS